MFRLLNRGGYGADEQLRLHARTLGLTAYLEKQLAPDSIDDAIAEQFVAGLDHYNRPISDLIDLRNRDQRQAIGSLMQATGARAIYSKRQLYEAMVEFWSDHFHIYIGKSAPTGLLKIVDDREVIRPNALGNFRDLLYASATSPAMLAYLDNARNRKETPNENYARELLELHTLGVDGGYTEQDVFEVARVMTGWTIDRRDGQFGKVLFAARRHDDGEKVVLGQRFPAGQGAGDLDQLVDFLAVHPATANRIATKLVRRFVADVPPPNLVTQVADVFLATGGEVKPMLRTVFLSNEFATAAPKLKRPYSYFVSTLRVLGIQPLRQAQDRPTVDTQFGRWLQQMGQVPFSWPAPNGYPDVSAAWSNNLLPRWNFALALAQEQLPGLPLSRTLRTLSLEDLATMILGHPLDEQSHVLYNELAETFAAENRAAPTDEFRMILWTAMLLIHPDFQMN